MEKKYKFETMEEYDLDTLEEKIFFFDENFDVQGIERGLGKNFIIVTPTGDDVDRNEEQYKNAVLFAEHVKQKMKTEHVEVLTKPTQMRNSPLIKAVDYLIFLYKFEHSEKIDVIDTVSYYTIRYGDRRSFASQELHH